MKKLRFEMVTQWCQISPERFRDIEQLFWDGRGRTAVGRLLKYKITYILYFTSYQLLLESWRASKRWKYESLSADLWRSWQVSLEEESSVISCQLLPCFRGFAATDLAQIFTLDAVPDVTPAENCVSSWSWNWDLPHFRQTKCLQFSIDVFHVASCAHCSSILMWTDANSFRGKWLLKPAYASGHFHILGFTEMRDNITDTI